MVLKRVGGVLYMIKKFFTLTVKFDNILGAYKYKKETSIPKSKITILGISKL